MERSVATVCSTGAQAPASFALLARIFDNVLKNPSEPKFRKLRLSNPALHGALVETEGALELLLSAGFRLEAGTEESGGCVAGPLREATSFIFD